ncbi:UvrD-helicase domain-containing protein [Salimicrobium album]|uniref:DNA 3'-5' helicase n=1 Tax=Salimicrobium album TaxID=50717 RepID=A0A1H3E5M5_9BACI|nr:ATP-dependent helicase [Salimicrobium album]SDX73224.1 Superfamily I DNA or RNA helicase [Salimicrobium album]
MKSNFEDDINVEAEVSKFIDKYLYPYIGEDFVRVHDFERQMKGIDVSLQNDKKTMLIDDKCAFYYANKNLRTFTFELSSLVRGSARLGWLLNKDLSTTHYNIMWLSTKNKSIDNKKIRFEDILEVEAMIIPKDRLWEYLDALGYNQQVLYDLNREFRDSGAVRKRMTPHMEMIMSKNKAERPINIKIDKSELTKLSDLHVKVSEKEILNLHTNSIMETIDERMVEPSGYKAERKVWNAIQNYARNRDCHTFMHFPLHKKGFKGFKEIDILTVDREHGLSVIEVKGISIEQIETIHGGEWHFNAGFYTDKANPFKQAVTQLDFLSNELEDEQLLFRRFSKRAVIALPYITRKEWKNRGFHKKINIPPVLFKDDLENSKGIERIHEYFVFKADQPLSDKQWRRMKQYFDLESNFSIAIPERYSLLYVFPDKLSFEDRKEEICEELSHGVKVFVLTYFELDQEWELSLCEFINSYQLQCFTSEGECPLDYVLEIEDGESALPPFISEHFRMFNLGQFDIVHAPHNEKLMVTAGAGTGKTHVMIDRIMFLLTKGVSLEDIIMITFTNESTKEMKKRLQSKLTTLSKITGRVKFGLYAEAIKDVEIKTIHSFSKDILTTLAHEIGYGKNVKVRSFVHEKKRVIRELINQHYRLNPNASYMSKLEHYKLETILLKFWDEVEKKGLSKKEMQCLSWGNAIDESYDSMNSLFEYVIGHCENRLDEVKKVENAVSTNDLIRKLKEFSNDGIKMKQLTHDKYLFMDEFQDSDNVQIDLVASLSKFLDYKIFVVGDIKQSIYRFRGADYKSFDLLDKKVKGTGEQESAFLHRKLNQNYRTASTILERLHQLFVVWGEKGWLTYSDELEGMNKRQKTNSEFKFYSANHEQAKRGTVEAVRYSMRLVKNLPEKKNKKISIIVRTNKQAKQVKQWFDSTGISTSQNLDGTFYTSQAVKDFKSLLDGLMFPGDAKHVLNTLQSPYFRYAIPYKLLLQFNGRDEEILAFIHSKIGDDFNKYFNQLKTLPVMAVIQKIISEKSLFRYLREYYNDKFSSQKELDEFLMKYKKNLFHLMNIIQLQFDMMNATLYNIYEWITLQMRTNRTENEPMVKTSEQTVDITTVHRSKGLEYHTVIIPKTNNSFDFKMTAFHIEENEDNHDLNRKAAWFIKDLKTQNSYYDELSKEDREEAYKEETRLLYVAMTRVKERLVVFTPHRSAKNTWAEIIEETGVEVIPYDS